MRHWTPTTCPAPHRTQYRLCLLPVSRCSKPFLPSFTAKISEEPLHNSSGYTSQPDAMNPMVVHSTNSVAALPTSIRTDADESYEEGRRGRNDAATMDDASPHRDPYTPFDSDHPLRGDSAPRRVAPRSRKPSTHPSWLAL